MRIGGGRFRCCAHGLGLATRRIVCDSKAMLASFLVHILCLPNGHNPSRRNEFEFRASFSFISVIPVYVSEILKAQKVKNKANQPRGEKKLRYSNDSYLENPTFSHVGIFMSSKETGRNVNKVEMTMKIHSQLARLFTVTSDTYVTIKS